MCCLLAKRSLDSKGGDTPKQLLAVSPAAVKLRQPGMTLALSEFKALNLHRQTVRRTERIFSKCTGVKLEWHLVVANPFQHIEFCFVPWFVEKVV